MYCCNDFIFKTEFYGYKSKDRVEFYSLNDLSDMDEEPHLDKSQLYLRVSDHYERIEYMPMNYCPFCGTKLD